MTDRMMNGCMIDKMMEMNGGPDDESMYCMKDKIMKRLTANKMMNGCAKDKMMKDELRTK